MADLYPTPLRLALLVDVAANNVRDDSNGVPCLHWHDEDGRLRSARVEGQMREMASAGWVEPGEGDTWQLTTAGYSVMKDKNG